MKLKTDRIIDGKPVYEIVTWDSHWCPKCENVDIDKSATFTNACVLGSQLIMEELAKRQVPVEKEKAMKVKAWAKRAGFQVEKSSKEYVQQITRYK